MHTIMNDLNVDFHMKFVEGNIHHFKELVNEVSKLRQDGLITEKANHKKDNVFYKRADEIEKRLIEALGYKKYNKWMGIGRVPLIHSAEYTR